MIWIAHRGNLHGKSANFENHPQYIDLAIKQNFDAEIDVWYKDAIYLGHDKPKYEIEENWLFDRKDKLWIHCKNIKAIEWFYNKKDYNYFWHQEDTLTLTSKGYIWVYPDKQPVQDSIAVLPELHNADISKCLGICSDNLKDFIK
jgi:hypothetical protein